MKTVTQGMQEFNVPIMVLPHSPYGKMEDQTKIVPQVIRALVQVMP